MSCFVRQVFAQRYPRYLLRVVNRHEEFYALLMFFVERHYLRKHGTFYVRRHDAAAECSHYSGASFSENFYGLKRRRRPLFETDRAKAAVPGVLPEERLRNREIWRSLIFLVSRIVPTGVHTGVTSGRQVGLPYLRTKAQEYYEDLGGGIQSEVIEESLASREARALSEEVRSSPSVLVVRKTKNVGARADGRGSPPPGV